MVVGSNALKGKILIFCFYINGGRQKVKCHLTLKRSTLIAVFVANSYVRARPLKTNVSYHYCISQLFCLSVAFHFLASKVCNLKLIFETYR